MLLNVAEREVFPKMVQNVISHMKKSKIVEHFTKEGNAGRTIYGTINLRGLLSTKNMIGLPTSWTVTKKSKLKILRKIALESVRRS